MSPAAIRKRRRRRIQAFLRGDVRVSPGDRLGWTQQAADAAEVASFQFALYVDGTRTTLTGVSCASAASGTAFDCSATLPTLSAGTHTLELASFVVDGSVTAESARSGAAARHRRGHVRSSFSASSMLVVTAEQVQLNLVARCRRLASSLGSRVRRRWIDLRRGARRRCATDSRRCARRHAGARSFSGDHAHGGRASRGRARSEVRRERADVCALRRGRAAERARVHARAIPLRGRRVRRARGAARSNGGVGRPAQAAHCVWGRTGSCTLRSTARPTAASRQALPRINGKVLRFNTDATTPDDQPRIEPDLFPRASSTAGARLAAGEWNAVGCRSRRQ